MKYPTQHLRIFLFITFVLSTFACNNTPKDKHLSNIETSPQNHPTPTLITPNSNPNIPPKEDKENKVEEPKKPKQFTLKEFVGIPLIEYPSLNPAKGQFTAEAFNRSEEFAAQKMPIYKISVNNEKLTKAVASLKTLIKDYQLTREVQDGDQIEIYQNDKQALYVNLDSGRVAYYNLEKFHTSSGIKQVDKKQLLKQAQTTFEQYLPKELLDNAYFYRFYEYVNTFTSDGKANNESSYQVVAALNPVLNGLPFIGSGGKYSVHLTHDGTVANIKLQYINPTPSDVSELGVAAVPEGVSIFDSKQALKKLDEALKKDGISLEDHRISRKELGYLFTTKNTSTKWLVPSYAFFIEPNEGVIDAKRVYVFPASNDPAALRAYEENKKIDSNRKREKMNERTQFDTTKYEHIG